jgi:hypothetical protein
MAPCLRVVADRASRPGKDSWMRSSHLLPEEQPTRTVAAGDGRRIELPRPEISATKFQDIRSGMDGARELRAVQNMLAANGLGRSVVLAMRNRQSRAQYRDNLYTVRNSTTATRKWMTRCYADKGFDT